MAGAGALAVAGAVAVAGGMSENRSQPSRGNFTCFDMLIGWI